MKLFSIDNLLATLLVLAVLKFMPYIFDADSLEPIQNTFEEFNISDIVFSKFRDYEDIPVDSNIVLVNIGYNDRIGIAEQISFINSFEPKVIGLDILFSDLKGPMLDDPLEAAMAETDHLVIVSFLEDYNPEKKKFDTLKLSHEKFRQWAVSGYSNLISRDMDRIKSINRFSPKEKYADSTVYAFATEVAKIYCPHEADVLLDRENEQEIINFKRNTDKYITFDFDDMYITPEAFEVCRDKIVLLGFMGPNLETKVTEDIVFTPLNENYVGRTHPDMYGMVVHANILSMINDRDYLGKNSFEASVALLFIIVYINMFLFSTLRSQTETWYEPASFLIIFTELFGMFVLLMYIFHFFGYEVTIAGNFLGILFSGAAFELYNDSFKPLAIEGYDRIADLIRGRRS